MLSVLIIGLVITSVISSGPQFFSNAVQSDIDCLRSLRDSLQDTQGILSSWNFNNNTEGFICRFTGVECWHPDESKVLNIKLDGYGITGTFPLGLGYCTSLTGLNLSSNKLSGPIPSNISLLLQFITSIDLSSNNFSGSIPESIANCTYLNILRLDNNQLTGQIPPNLVNLPLRTFNVANNYLTGSVPQFSGNAFIAREDYANNEGLCGLPILDPCKVKHHHQDNERDLFISGFMVGYAVFMILVMLLIGFLVPSLSIHKDMLYLLNNLMRKVRTILETTFQTLVPNESLKRIRRDSKDAVSALEKLVTRFPFAELQTATNDFCNDNVIFSGRTGTTYQALLPNGWSLAIKRFHRESEILEKEFTSEILILGRMRHRNLLPMLGFCSEDKKKLLVYKYMPNGSLHKWLHEIRPGHEGMAWNMRVRIAVGVARGLAWLHHNNIFRVAHNNIGSKCILLDKDFEPKISNFGDAKFTSGTSTPGSSSWSLWARGSDVPPDSASYKKDVYCFGMLLLELITGKVMSVECMDHVISSGSNAGVGFADCLMNGQARIDEEAYQVLLPIALRCIQLPPDHRPTMLAVYHEIRAIGWVNDLANDPEMSNIMDSISI